MNRKSILKAVKATILSIATMIALFRIYSGDVVAGLSILALIVLLYLGDGMGVKNKDE